MTHTTTQRPTDEQKRALWDDYHARRPARVPMIVWTNPRVVLLRPDWNPEGYTFRQAAEDPKVHVDVWLRHELYKRQVIGRYTDWPTDPPDVWRVELFVYNVYEAAMLGAELAYFDQQVPDTHPFLDASNREAIFDVDLARPLDWAFNRDRLAFWHEMEKVCEGYRFEGRPVRLAPWAPLGTDGPVTVGCNVRGAEFMLDLSTDPDYADRLMNFLTDAALARRQAFRDYWGDRIGAHPGNGLADDSCALISNAMYEQRVMPIHRRWYESAQTQPGGERSIHLCGDATRLFPLLKEKLGVTAFDTGFPVDFGPLRRTLGPDVEVQGGVEVALLLKGSADDIYERSKAILTSGIKEGRRFIFREGNNLPPNVPDANLEAMYAACLEYGTHED